MKNKSNDFVNANSGSKDPVEKALSNFSDHRFWLGRERFPCVEIFIQWIKFPEDDAMRDLLMNATPLEAKRLGQYAKRDFVYWRGRKLVYGSKQHRKLIERAIEAKFDDNPDAMESLLSTVGKTIAHNVGPESPNTSLTRVLFCEILTRIRDRNAITMDKLVVLKYADNECYVQVVSVEEAMDQYAGFFDINLAKREWRYGKQKFKISHSRECSRGSRGGIIGVYNRESVNDLDAMAHAATAAVETDHVFSCD